MPTANLSGESLSWIFGSSRSGSTWLLRMLSGIDGVTPIDDPHLGHHLGVWRPIPLAWATAEETPRLGTLHDFKAGHESYFFSEKYRDIWQPGLRNLILERFRAQAEQNAPDANGQRHLIVKEPGSQAAGLLLDLFPESNLIFLVRDGRDVVDSWLDAYSEDSWAIREGAFPVAEEGRPALIEWLSTVWETRTALVQELFDRHDPERRVELRYETMRSDPVAALSAVRDRFGLEASDETLAEIADRHAFERVDPDNRGSGQEVRSAQPGSWQRNLSDQEAASMMRIMGPTLERLGYEKPRREAGSFT